MNRPRGWLGSLAVLLLLTGSSAPAGAQTAEELLHQGVDRFDNGAFAASRELLMAARHRTREPRLLGPILLYLGLNEAVENQPERARVLFREALSYQPQLRVDPEQFKPSVVSLFDEVRRELEGELRIDSDRSDLRVWIDGVSQGAPPLQRPLLAGDHVVEARGPGGQVVFRATVPVVKGRTVRLALGRPRPEPLTRPAATQAGPVTQPAAPASTGSARRGPRRVWTWVTGAGALVALGTAIGLSVSARSDYQGACDLLRPRELGCDDRTRLADDDQSDRFRRLRDGMDSKALGANICFGIAGALAVTSVALYFVEARRPVKDRAEPTRPSVSWAAPLLLRVSY